ncbi:hypothetical protein HW555_003656 [Spodoptera exigua]|uniref:RecF/RecN/SMC N-terminal domain-containing protein n=1 Tax=Spodoptera exigua TaxID=7107 RepID=A0A835GMY3_SPOEX|nr:hypothetical protein HW555_003656 [Spodoptera exigua]
MQRCKPKYLFDRIHSFFLHCHHPYYKDLDNFKRKRRKASGYSTQGFRRLAGTYVCIQVKVGFNGTWKESLGELSGGQRSLVALSLVLGMLRWQPAPLYVLDEVDAALDLSHTQNIGLMLRTHFRHSQVLSPHPLPPPLPHTDAALDLSHTQNIGLMLRTHFRHSQVLSPTHSLPHSPTQTPRSTSRTHRTSDSCCARTSATRRYSPPPTPSPTPPHRRRARPLAHTEHRTHAAHALPPLAGTLPHPLPPPLPHTDAALDLSHTQNIGLMLRTHFRHSQVLSPTHSLPTPPHRRRARPLAHTEHRTHAAHALPPLAGTLPHPLPPHSPTHSTPRSTSRTHRTSDSCCARTSATRRYSPPPTPSPTPPHRRRARPLAHTEHRTHAAHALPPLAGTLPHPLPPHSPTQTPRSTSRTHRTSDSCCARTSATRRYSPPPTPSPTPPHRRRARPLAHTEHRTHAAHALPPLAGTLPHPLPPPLPHTDAALDLSHTQNIGLMLRTHFRHSQVLSPTHSLPLPTQTPRSTSRTHRTSDSCCARTSATRRYSPPPTPSPLPHTDAALDLSHTQNIGLMLRTHFRHSQVLSPTHSLPTPPHRRRARPLAHTEHRTHAAHALPPLAGTLPHPLPPPLPHTDAALDLSHTQNIGLMLRTHFRHSQVLSPTHSLPHSPTQTPRSTSRTLPHTEHRTHAAHALPPLAGTLPPHSLPHSPTQTPRSPTPHCARTSDAALDLSHTQNIGLMLRTHFRHSQVLSPTHSLPHSPTQTPRSTSRTHRTSASCCARTSATRRYSPPPTPSPTPPHRRRARPLAHTEHRPHAAHALPPLAGTLPPPTPSPTPPLTAPLVLQFIIVSLKDGMFNNANVLFRTRFVDGMSSVQRTTNVPR